MLSNQPSINPKFEIKTEITVDLPKWCRKFIAKCEGRVFYSDEEKMQLVEKLLKKQIEKGTGGPFAAIIFNENDTVVSIGVNRVVPLKNSTAHAEMVSFQLGEAAVGAYTLAGGKYTLATSAQPCAQCLGASVWAGVKKVITGVDAKFTEILGFDEGPIHPSWRKELEKRGIQVVEGVREKQIKELMSRYAGAVYNGASVAGEAKMPGSKNVPLEELVGNAAGREYVAQLLEAGRYVQRLIPEIPKTLIVLGSGLGGLVDRADVKLRIPYAEIPNMPVPTTPGHQGNLIYGSLDGTDVLMFQGRAHMHEGKTSQEAAFGVRAMKLAGVENFIITNAAGSLNSTIRVGDIMVIENHFSLLLSDPSLGLVHPALGLKFYEQTCCYDQEMIGQFKEIAADIDRPAASGNYAFILGPRFESAVDVKILQSWKHIDAVGMSTIPEVLALYQMGAKVLAVSTITNEAAGIDGAKPNDDEVQMQGRETGPRLAQILQELVKRI